MTSKPVSQFGVLVHCGFMLMAITLSVWLYRENGAFEITHFQESLALIVPISFFAGVAVGLVVEFGFKNSRIRVNKFLWIGNVFAYLLLWFLSSALQFYRE